MPPGLFRAKDHGMFRAWYLTNLSTGPSLPLALVSAIPLIRALLGQERGSFVTGALTPSSTPGPQQGRMRTCAVHEETNSYSETRSEFGLTCPGEERH